jgi:hypothetical protein
LTICVCLFFVFGCSDRSEKFLENYAEAELIELGSNDYSPNKEYKYISGHSYKNSTAAINGQLKDLEKRSLSTKAIANVYGTESNGINQCIIVHRPDMSKSTLTHELGHCFNIIYLGALKENYPTLFDIIEKEKDGYRFLIESFADVAASTVAYNIDGSNSYLESRIMTLEKTVYSEDMKPYLRSIPLLKSLNVFLSKNDLPSKPSEQVEFILEKFYLNTEFNKALKRN